VQQVPQRRHSIGWVDSALGIFVLLCLSLRAIDPDRNRGKGVAISTLVLNR
jgi:hypothetical protein